MMQLLLVRHAEAEPTLMQVGATDFHRALTPLGKLQADSLAQELLVRGVHPYRILTSPLVRAVETAERLANVLTTGQEFHITERLALGELRPRKLSKFLSESAQTPLMLVGHMPDIAAYAGWLLGAEPEAIDFDKSSTALIQCRHEIGKGTGRLEWLISPSWFMPAKLTDSPDEYPE